MQILPTTARLPAGHNPDRVRAVLEECASFDDVRAAGILFHGTCETIHGDLRGGGYDGVFWTAETPSIAQAYIPRSGITLFITRPTEYERDRPIRPCKGGHETAWALTRAGVALEDLDIEWDGWSARSWRIPPGWPTQGDYEAMIRGLGYRPNRNGIYEVAERIVDGTPRMMPVDWKMPGHLLILLPEDLVVSDPPWSDEARGYANHNRIGDFERFARSGIQAIRMSDQLQSDHLGNVGHHAIGILPAGLDRLSWMAIPATRHDGEDLDVFRRPGTAEFDAFMAGLSRECEVETITPAP